MKTNFRRKNEASHTRRILIIIALLFGLIIAARFLKSPLLVIAKPLLQGGNMLSHSWQNVTAIFTSKTNLEAENNALKQKLADYADLVLSCRAVVSSRDSLLDSFGRTASSTGIAAGILAHPPEIPYDALLIDAGTEEGVRVGERVLLPVTAGLDTGSEIGTISETFDHSAKVRLYTSSGLSTDALLERGTIPIVLKGNGGGDFEFDAPRGLTVVVGDKVLSPHIEGGLLGVIKDVSANATDSFQHVTVASVANIYTVHVVLIKP